MFDFVSKFSRLPSSLPPSHAKHWKCPRSRILRTEWSDTREGLDWRSCKWWHWYLKPFKQEEKYFRGRSWNATIIYWRPDNPFPCPRLKTLHADALVVGLQLDGDPLQVVRPAHVPEHATVGSAVTLLFVCQNFLIVRIVSPSFIIFSFQKSSKKIFWILKYFEKILKEELERRRVRHWGHSRLGCVPGLLLEHGGPVFPALHHEGYLSPHLTMKVWYPAHGIATGTQHSQLVRIFPD